MSNPVFSKWTDTEENAPSTGELKFVSSNPTCPVNYQTNDPFVKLKEGDGSFDFKLDEELKSFSLTLKDEKYQLPDKYDFIVTAEAEGGAKAEWSDSITIVKPGEDKKREVIDVEDDK